MGARDPILSVVVPTKGRPRYLEGCLAALAAADCAPDRFEVVVVNDGGDPEVNRTVSSYTGRLPVELATLRASGPSAARNAGAAAARGRYIAFTDDDCRPTPEWVPELERALERNPGAAVGGEMRNGVPQSRAAASQIVADVVRAHFNRDPELPRFFASSNLAFPAEPFRELGGFDEEFRYAEDREMCERWISSGHRFVHAPEALVYHMRTLTLRDFLGQHYGYGRGASAFHRARAAGPQRGADLAAMLRDLARETLRRDGERARAAIAGYVALSQLATAAGFGREAAAAQLQRRRA